MVIGRNAGGKPVHPAEPAHPRRIEFQQFHLFLREGAVMDEKKPMLSVQHGKAPVFRGVHLHAVNTPATCGLDLPVGAADSHRLAWITVPERSGDDLPEDPGPIDSLRLAPIRISPPVQSPFTAQFTKPRDENGTSSQCPPCTSKHIYCIESPPEAKTPTCIACRTPIPSIRGTSALPRRCPTRPRRTRLTFDLSNKPSQGKKAGTNERT